MWSLSNLKNRKREAFRHSWMPIFAQLCPALCWAALISLFICEAQSRWTVNAEVVSGFKIAKWLHRISDGRWQTWQSNRDEMNRYGVASYASIAKSVS